MVEHFLTVTGELEFVDKVQNDRAASARTRR